MRVHSENTMHFWHHMMAEFFPVLAKIPNVLPSKLYVFHPRRQWGACPLDRFYLDMGKGLGIQVLLVNERPVDVPVVQQHRRWDRLKGNMHSHDELRYAIGLVKRAARKYTDGMKHDVVVQNRGDSKDLERYYSKSMAGPCGKRGQATRGTPMYGRRRRFVQGFDLITPTLNRFGYNAVDYKGDTDSLLLQAAMYMSARGMVLEHGAGMVWMLFLPENSPVLEISPPPMKDNPDPDMTAQFARLHYHRLYMRCDGRDPMCTGKAVNLRDVGIRPVLRFSGFFPKNMNLRPTNQRESVLTPVKVKRLLTEHVAQVRQQESVNEADSPDPSLSVTRLLPSDQQASLSTDHSGIRIPKIVHQTAKKKNTCSWQKTWVLCHRTWKRDYPEPEYRHEFWSDDRLDKFIRKEYREYYRQWLRLPVPIQRIDIARYLILHKFGGIYADMDFESLRNMYCTLDQGKINIVESPYKRNENLHNSLLACEPGRNFWIEAVRTAFRRVSLPKERTNVLWTTGPRLMDELNRRGPRRIHMLAWNLYQPHVSGKGKRALTLRHSKEARATAYTLHHLTNSWCK